MESFEVCLLKYRHAIRNTLFQVGITSNPGSSDDELLDALSVRITGRPISWVDCPKCSARFPHQFTLNVHLNEDH